MNKLDMSRMGIVFVQDNPRFKVEGKNKKGEKNRERTRKLDA